MAYLSAEREKLSTDALEQGVVETFHQYGFRSLAQKLPFITKANGNQKWNVEKSEPQESVAQDPHARSVQKSQNEYTTVSVDTGMLSTDAETALYDQTAESDTNDQRAQELFGASKDLVFGFASEMINATGQTKHLHGLEYYLTKYAGFADPDGSHEQIDSADPLFPGRKIFYHSGSQSQRYPPVPTNNNRKALALPMLDDLVSRFGDQPWDLFITDRETLNWIKALFRSDSGGLLPRMIMDEDFGERVLSFDGVPIIRHEDVGASRSGTSPYGASISSASDQLTIDSPSSDQDDEFLGLTDKDVGRDITLAKGTVDEETLTIKSVEGFRSATTTTNAAATHSDVDWEMPAINAIYALRFHETDGVSAMYNPIAGVDGNLSNQYPESEPVAGFNVRRFGEVDDGRFLLDKLDWVGTFRVGGIKSIARATHYKAPSVV